MFGFSEKNLIPKQSNAYSLGTLQIKRGTSAIHQSQKDTVTPWMSHFYEQQPYYPKFDIQGMNYTWEYQLWDIKANIANSSQSPLNSYTDPSSQVPQTESLRAFVPTPSPRLEIPQAKPQNPLPGPLSP